jgi:multidrug transporter EmrE-like cation transporter
MSKLLLYTFVLASSETIAMTVLTKYSKTSNYFYLIMGIVIYGIIIPYMVLSSLKFSGIGTVNFLWNIITTVSMIFIAYYLFNEKLNHLHLISLLLGISSIFILYKADGV